MLNIVYKSTFCCFKTPLHKNISFLIIRILVIHVSRNNLCFINYPADSHSNYPPLSFFSSSPSRWITGVIRMNVCPALNEIVISVVVISVGDMNHCPSVLTSSHPAPGYRQPSHANSLAHRVQFSLSNKAPG